jgi:hypothetical protein
VLFNFLAQDLFEVFGFATVCPLISYNLFSFLQQGHRVHLSRSWIKLLCPPLGHRLFLCSSVRPAMSSPSASSSFRVSLGALCNSISHRPDFVSVASCKVLFFLLRVLLPAQASAKRFGFLCRCSSNSPGPLFIFSSHAVRDISSPQSPRAGVSRPVFTHGDLGFDFSFCFRESSSARDGLWSASSLKIVLKSRLHLCHRAQLSFFGF